MHRSSSGSRDRRMWSREEDDVLRREAELQARRTGAVSDWLVIASKLSNRTNKDCRKRWSKISGGVSKGSWSADEDQRLRTAVAARGSKWTEVARDVGSRNADQCSKRWLHFLDPRLDRGKWSTMDDARLLNAVSELGTDWKRICENHFPSRSATNVKNRYNNIKQRASPGIATDSASASLSTYFDEAGASTSWFAGVQGMTSRVGEQEEGSTSVQETLSSQDQLQSYWTSQSADNRRGYSHPATPSLDLDRTSSINDDYSQWAADQADGNSLQYLGGTTPFQTQADVQRSAYPQAPQASQSPSPLHPSPTDGMLSGLMDHGPQVEQRPVQQYSVMIENVSEPAINGFIDMLNNAGVQYQMQLTPVNVGPQEGFHGDLLDSRRQNVRIDDMAPAVIQHFIQALNATDLQGRAQIVTRFA